MIIGIYKHYSVIPSSINDLNFPIKTNRLTNWINKEDTSYTSEIEMSPKKDVTLG